MTSAAPTIRARITEVTYEVEGSPDPVAITAAWRGGEAYAVARGGFVWNGDEWEYEPRPSSREDDFLARTRFTYDEANAIALRLTRESI